MPRTFPLIKLAKKLKELPNFTNVHSHRYRWFPLIKLAKKLKVALILMALPLSAYAKGFH